MKYRNIKIIVVISIIIGIYALFGHITFLVLSQLPAPIIGFSIAIIETIFLFMIIPILYLRHLNKIKNIK